MPSISEQLQNEKRQGRFDEIHEVVRVFTIYNEAKAIKVRITLSRYYHDSGVSYNADYERADEHGQWHEESYGSVLTGSESEESTIMMSISLASQSLGI